MTITIGDAIIYLRGNDQKLDGDLDKAETKTKGFAQRVAGQIKESMTFAIGQVMAQGIDTLSRGIENLARDVVDLGMEYTAQVEEMARLTGASAEDASRIIQVADDMQVSYSEVSDALKMYSKSQKDAGSAANVSIDSLARLSDQYLKLAPGVERANFLMKNFGRNGLTMGELMEQGGVKIREMAAGVSDSLVVTEDGIRATREYRQAMDEWNDAIASVKFALFNQLQPYLNQFADWLVNVGIKKLEEFIGWFEKLPEPLKVTTFALGGLIVLLAKLGPALMGLATIVSLLGGGGAAAGGGGILAGLAAALAAVSAPVWVLISAIALLVAVMVEMGPTAKVTFMMIADIIAASLKRAGYELGKFGTQMLNWAIQTNEKVRTWFKSIGKAIVDGIKGGIQDGWEGLKTWISTNLNSLLDWVKDKLGISSPSLVFAAEVGRPMAQGIGMGFEDALRNQVQATINASVAGLTGASSGVDSRTMIGNVELHATLTNTERRLLLGETKQYSERALLSALRKGAWK